MLSIRFLTAPVVNRLRQIRRDQRGVSAVEFAMIAPLMIMLYFGVIEVSQGVAVDRKVMLAARSLADLVSQSMSVTGTERSNVFDAAIAVTEPYKTTPLKMTMTQVKIDPVTSKASVDWSFAKGTGASPKTGDVTTNIPVEFFPNPKAPAGTPAFYLIWGEAEYTYVPIFARPVIGTLTFRERSFMSPRQSTKVDNLP
jgi:Flp pilus assembly protein TadG